MEDHTTRRTKVKENLKLREEKRNGKKLASRPKERKDKYKSLAKTWISYILACQEVLDPRAMASAKASATRATCITKLKRQEGLGGRLRRCS